MILLDTCTLLWLSNDPPRLPSHVLRTLREAPPGGRYLSAITPYEIGVKHGRGQLVLPKSPREWLDVSCAQRGITVLPVTREIAQLASELPWHHRDPADRMIIATGLLSNLTIVTPDPAFRLYDGVSLSW